MEIQSRGGRGARGERESERVDLPRTPATGMPVSGSAIADSPVSVSRSRSIRAFAIVGFVGLLVWSSTPLEAGDTFVLRAGNLPADPASTVSIPVTFDSTTGIRALSFGLTHDAAILTLDSIVPDSAITALDPDYFFSDIAPEDGDGGVVGILFSLSPPIEELPAGLDQPIATFNYQTAPLVAVGTESVLAFSGALADPPVEVLVAVRGQGIVPDTESGSLLFNPPPVADLTCSLTDPCESIYAVTWTNPESYSSIQVLVNGMQVASLSGFSTSTSVDLDAPGVFVVEVIANAMGLTSEAAVCDLGSVDPVPPSPTGLSCAVDPDTCEVMISWTNPSPYLTLELSIDGTLVETLDGMATSAMTTVGITAVEISLVGTSDCGPTAPSVCFAACGVSFVRGDCNGDLGFDIADAVAGLSTLFSGGDPVGCLDACDSNDDGAFDIADMVFILANLFSGGAAPATPFPDCGVDATSDAIDCLFSPCV